MDYCLVIIAGTLVEEPLFELDHAAGGTCRGVIGYRAVWRTSSGEERDKVHPVDYVIHGARAKAFAAHHEAGDPAFLEGELRSSESGTWLHVTDWRFAAPRRESDAGRRWGAGDILEEFTQYPGGSE